MGAIGRLSIIRNPLQAIFGLALFSLPAFGETVLYLDDLVPDGDGYAVLDVILETDESVGGLQGDLLFDNRIVDLVRGNCKINPAIGLFPRGEPPVVSCFEDTNLGPCKNLATAVHECGQSPRPQSCPEGAGDGITSFRGVITSTATLNNNAIPSSVVFTCRFRIVDLTRLAAGIRLTNVVFSDPIGTRLDGSSRDLECDRCAPDGCYGNVDCSSFRCESADGDTYPGHCVSAPTLTPSPIDAPPPVPSPTPTSLPVGVTALRFDDPVRDGDQHLVVSVVLDTDVIVGAFQSDLLFDDTIVDLEAGDCQINPALGLFPLGAPPAISCFDDANIGPCKNLTKALKRCDKDASQLGCLGFFYSTISIIRSFVIATAVPNLHPIPGGAVFSCRFRILDPARLSTRILLNEIVVSDPYGSRVNAPIRASVCLGDCPSEGCYGDLDCDSLDCELASGGGYPGRCWSLPTPTPASGCGSDSDCASGNCDLSMPSDDDVGTCGAPRRTPGFNGSGCAPASCVSGYCVDDVCCQAATCGGSDRCDIFGFEGNCTSPRPEGDECRSHRDCAYPFGCIAGRCAALNLTPVPITPEPQFPTGPEAPAPASEPVTHAAGDGCGISRRGATNRASWLLVFAALIVVARSRARARHL